MPTLTPADVHNVAFSRPPIGKRGYNEEEVDQFLDLVEVELSRLIEENADLQQRVSELNVELGEAQENVQAAAAVQTAEQPVAVQPIAATPKVPGDSDTNLKAAHILGLAQEMADRLTCDARREADELLSSARFEADSMVSQANETADRRLHDAESTIATMEAEAERKHSEVMETINKQRSVLEGRIDQLRTFERQYRSRLQDLLEGQLADLRGSNIGESFG